MSIINDIKILQGYIELSKAFAGEQEREAQKPIHDALQRVAEYAHYHATKDIADEALKNIEKIMKGETH